MSAIFEVRVGLTRAKESKNLDPVTEFLTDTGTNVWRAIKLKLDQGLESGWIQDVGTTFRKEPNSLRSTPCN